MDELKVVSKKRRWAAPLALGLLSFVAYAATLPTTFSFEDSAEFVTASASLGVAHPSGYPLYVLLGRAFAALPFGTVPWRLALFSAVCAAGALAAMFVVTRTLLESKGERLTWKDEAVMAVALGTFAVTPLWWSQAVYAKVYALHTLLLAVLTLAALRYRARASMRGAAVAGLCFGLACANHLFLTLLAVPWLVALLWPARAGARRGRDIAAFIGATLVGLLPYLYILLRMPGAPYATTTFTGTLGWLKFIGRSNYADVGVSSFADRSSFIAEYGFAYWHELAVLLPLAVAGLIQLTRGAWRQRGTALWLFGLTLTPFIIVLLRSMSFSDEAAYAYRVYAVASLAFAAVLGAVGAVWLWRRAWTGWQRGALAAVLLAGVAVNALQAQPIVRLTTDSFVEQWARQTLASLPPDAVFVILEEGFVSDTQLFSLAYLQVVEGDRRDVTVVTEVPMKPFLRPTLPEAKQKFSLPLQRRMLLEAAMAEPSLQGRPLLTSFPPGTALPDLRSRATGYAYALDMDAPLPEAPRYVTPRDITQSFAARLIMAHMRYLEAARYQQAEGLQAAGPAFMEALDLDVQPQSSDYLGYISHRASLREVE